MSGGLLYGCCQKTAHYGQTQTSLGFRLQPKIYLLSAANSYRFHHKSSLKNTRALSSIINLKDETVSCFRDIHPGAPHHHLVVPSKHVGNCKSLGKEHVPLVEKLVEMGKEILQKNDVTDLNDVRFGFHWPPFCSVTHLHLHVLAPVSQMGFMSRLIYRLNSYWFVTADQLLQRLNSMS